MVDGRKNDNSKRERGGGRENIRGDARERKTRSDKLKQIMMR